MKYLRYGGPVPRKQAWVGAAISTAGTLIGSLFSSNSQKEAAKAAAREAEYQNTLSFGNNLSEQMNGMKSAQKAYEEQFRALYKNGGRSRLRNAVGITDGGIAIPAPNNSFLLRGSTHEEVNESGNTGIGIKVGNNEIEAENNEVVDFDNSNLRVYSDSIDIPIKYNGKTIYTTPAKAVLAGYNKNKVFNKQQRINGNSHGINQKAKLGADVTSLGINTLGSIGTNIINQIGLNNLKKYTPKRPIPYQAAKFVTNYNINPQLSGLDRQRSQAYDNINKNMISSSSAINSMNTIGLNTTLAKNELYNTKYNKEGELLNADASNQQDINNKTISNYNDWRNQYANYMSDISSAKTESNTNMIQGISSSIGGFMQGRIDRKEQLKNRLAYLAASDNGNPRILGDYGLLDNDQLKYLYDNAYRSGNTEDINYYGSKVNPKWKAKYDTKYNLPMPKYNLRQNLNYIDLPFIRINPNFSI